MKKLGNTEADLKKSVAYKEKSCNPRFYSVPNSASALPTFLRVYDN